MADKPPTVAPNVVAAIAVRAAIRAQPTFQFHSPPPPDDLREALEAIHVCVWSGAAVFMSHDYGPRLLAPLELAVPIASPWLLDPPRPELVAARMVHSLPQTSSESGIDPMIAATRRIDPPALAERMVDAITADMSRAAQGLRLATFASLPLWPDGVPRAWPPILKKWSEHLHFNRLEELAGWHSTMIEAVVKGGSFDWETPFAFLDQWHARHVSETAHPESKRPTTTLRAKAASESTPPSPLDLTAYSWSHGARAIVATAVYGLSSRKRTALSSTALLLEMAEAGQPVADPQWIGDFVRQAVAAHPGPYSSALESYGFQRDRERVSGTEAKVRDRMKGVLALPGLRWRQRGVDLSRACPGSPGSLAVAADHPARRPAGGGRPQSRARAADHQPDCAGVGLRDRSRRTAHRRRGMDSQAGRVGRRAAEEGGGGAARIRQGACRQARRHG